MYNKITSFCLEELDISRASKLRLVVSLNLNSWYDSSQVMLITEAVIRLSIPH